MLRGYTYWRVFRVCGAFQPSALLQAIYGLSSPLTFSWQQQFKKHD